MRATGCSDILVKMMYCKDDIRKELVAYILIATRKTDF